MVSWSWIVISKETRTRVIVSSFRIARVIKCCCVYKRQETRRFICKVEESIVGNNFYTNGASKSRSPRDCDGWRCVRNNIKNKPFIRTRRCYFHIIFGEIGSIIEGSLVKGVWRESSWNGEHTGTDRRRSCKNSGLNKNWSNQSSSNWDVEFAIPHRARVDGIISCCITRHDSGNQDCESEVQFFHIW